jgi:hypothetical protein
MPKKVKPNAAKGSQWQERKTVPAVPRPRRARLVAKGKPPKSTQRVVRAHPAVAAARARSATSKLLRAGLGDLFDVAPAAVSMSSATPPIVVLPSGPGRKRIRIRASLCELAQVSAGQPNVLAGSVGGFWIQSASAAGGGTTPLPQATLLLNPLRMIALQAATSTTFTIDTTYWDSIRIALEGAGFSRYRLCSDFELEYEPNSTTASAGAFTLSLTADPYSPNNGYMAYENLAPPTYNTVASGDNFVTFSSWAAWKRKFIVDQKTEFYNYYRDEAGATTVVPTDVRTASFGALTCIANGFSTAATIYGRLIASFDIEFFDPSPVLNGHLVLPSLLRMYQSPELLRPRLGPRRAGLPSEDLHTVTSSSPRPIENKDGVARVSCDDDDYVTTTPPARVSFPPALPPGPLPPGPPPRTPSIKKS